MRIYTVHIHYKLYANSLYDRILVCTLLTWLPTPKMTSSLLYMKHEQVLFIRTTAHISDFMHKLANSL